MNKFHYFSFNVNFYVNLFIGGNLYHSQGPEHNVGGPTLSKGPSVYNCASGSHPLCVCMPVYVCVRVCVCVCLV